MAGTPPFWSLDYKFGYDLYSLLLSQLLKDDSMVGLLDHRFDSDIHHNSDPVFMGEGQSSLTCC